MLTPAVEKARSSKHEATIQRLAPKMSRAFETAALAAQRRIDLDVLAANIEAGRVGRVLRQLDMDAFVTSDVVPTINFIADAYEQGYERGVVAKIGEKNRPAAVPGWMNHKGGKYYGSKADMEEVAAKIPGSRIGIVQQLRGGRGGTFWGLQNDNGQWLGPQGWNEGVTANPRTPKPSVGAPPVPPKPPTPPAPSNPLLPSFGLDLKTTNPKALAAAERQAADLLTSVNVETKQTVRDIIARSYREQVSPRDTAKLIRDVVGLNDRQANALFNYRAGLVEDGRVPEQIDRMTERYGNRLLRQRADTIAQTEIHRASATGQHDLWREGVREGYVNAVTARRIWIANAGACEWCQGIEDLNADGVEIDGQFVTPSGDLIDGPEDSHVGCRCSTGLKTE